MKTTKEFKIRNSFWVKAVAAYLAIFIVFEGMLAGDAYGLTGGPSQPEVNSFEPMTTNQMVDLFSGDFTYNIPLLTVPGPNGGYPINMAYHAGIGLEQEASWVGLGWNINPGVINRNKRGLPDDFNGEKIEKLAAKFVDGITTCDFILPPSFKIHRIKECKYNYTIM